MLPVLFALLQAVGGPSGPPLVRPASPTPPPAAPAADVYSGRARRIDVRAPRLNDTVTIDGVLDEPAWQRASLLTDFTSYSPVDGRPAQDSIEVRVWYAPEALYVGIRAFAPPGTVRATLAERDRIASDDWIALHLDTFLDRR
ncbi:MAG: hypothetical protein RLZZ97_957, partial [Gemmatimonadota bacterium]